MNKKLKKLIWWIIALINLGIIILAIGGCITMTNQNTPATNKATSVVIITNTATIDMANKIQNISTSQVKITPSAIIKASEQVIIKTPPTTNADNSSLNQSSSILAEQTVNANNDVESDETLIDSTAIINDEQETKQLLVEASPTTKKVSPTPPPTATAITTVMPIATTAPTAVTVANSAIIWEDTVTIPTYNYEQAMFTTPDFPYPQVNKDLVGPLEPKTYQTIILENDVLRLTFLPALGGRLYQITDKISNQNVLYTNPVIKPTHWGPEEMTWWLMIGGMEWAFPVEEHGYAWAFPWDTSTSINEDGAAIISLRFTDKVTNLATTVSVVLPASGYTFWLSLNLNNTGSTPAAGQLWTNTAFLAGPDMRLDMPADMVEIHASGPADGLEVGKIIPWESGFMVWGRWKDWFSVFAAPTNGTVAKIWGSGHQLGLRRDFNPETAHGFKLFTWGTQANKNEFEGELYYEVWGGLTTDFETTITLNPGESQGWSESWTVITR